MPKKHTFTATIQNASGASGGGAFVEVPFDVEKAFGAKKPKVKATFEGVPYRGILARMGTDYHILIILKSIREQIELDAELRVIEIPKDLMKELKKNKDAKVFFDKLAYTHRREYVMWINEAKRAETRQNRIVKTIEMLKKGKKQS
jgi:hypothetical protein